MASITLADRGAAESSIEVARSSGTTSVRVTIGTAAFDRQIILTTAEIAAALTAGERTALQSSLGKLYDAALSKAGFL